MDHNHPIALQFSLRWKSQHATHVDQTFIDSIDLERDQFPGSMIQQLSKLQIGDICSTSYAPGILVSDYDSGKRLSIKPQQFQRDLDRRPLTPRPGRFYPPEFADSVLSTDTGGSAPFRVVELSPDRYVIDINHPLAGYPLTLDATRVATNNPTRPRPQASNHITAAITNGGPGMQSIDGEFAADYFRQYPLARGNDSDDALYYRQPRFSAHIDSTARRQIENIYRLRLPPNGRVLDLMSSYRSHIPDQRQDLTVVGLGLNAEELIANRRLSDYHLHDLNADPRIPFKNNCFDAVICTASIEYLVQPVEIMTEIARVTKPGGIFITTCSTHWFPGKEVEFWSQIHPFERQAFVLECYRRSHAFEQLYSQSIRGLPRPRDEKMTLNSSFSDAIFMVCGQLKKT